MPATIFTDDFTLTGSGGSALVRVQVDTQVPLVNAPYTWTYTVTNLSVGSNDPQDYINSDSLTSFWTHADATVIQAQSEFALASPPSGWSSGLFASATSTTTIYNGLYAGSNPTHPLLGHGESATFSFTTAARPIVSQEATFGDDTFGEATGFVVGPGAGVGVSVAAVTDAVESGSGGGFKFTRTGDVSQPLTVNFAVSGTAVEGVDYDTLPRTVTFAANEYHAVLPVTAISDTLVEGIETVVVTITSGTGYQINPDNEADGNTEGYLSSQVRTNLVAGDAGLVILDNVPFVWVDQSVREFDEGNSGNIILRRGGANLNQSLSVDIWLGPADGLPSATWGTDFTIGNPGQYTLGWNTIAFAANQTEFSIPVTSIQDGIPDGNEWLKVAIGESTAYLPTMNPELAFVFADTPNDRTGERNGIDWTTLDLNDPNKRRAASWGRILGTEYKVKTKNGGDDEIWVFTPLQDVNLQPNAIKPLGWEINYNCHGYSLNATGIKFPGGQVRDFSIIDHESSVFVFNIEFDSRTAAQAKADLAAGKRVVAVIQHQVRQVTNGVPGKVISTRYAHPFLPTTIQLQANGVDLDIDASKGNSKNGWRKLAEGANVSFREMRDGYKAKDRPLNPDHDNFTDILFFTLK